MRGPFFSSKGGLLVGSHDDNDDKVQRPRGLRRRIFSPSSLDLVAECLEDFGRNVIKSLLPLFGLESLLDFVHHGFEVGLINGR